MTVDVPAMVDENNVIGLADAVPDVMAVIAARETVVSPPNSSDPARAVRRPRRMPVFNGLPPPSGALYLFGEWSRRVQITRQPMLRIA